MKNIFCIFERPFKIQKNGVFIFEISFFVLEILTFFYYANEISDDVILFTTKNGKIVDKRYLWKYGSCVLETCIINVHHERNTMTPLMPLPWQQFGHWCCLNKN